MEISHFFLYTFTALYSNEGYLARELGSDQKFLFHTRVEYEDAKISREREREKERENGANPLQHPTQKTIIRLWQTNPRSVKSNFPKYSRRSPARKAAVSNESWREIAFSRDFRPDFHQPSPPSSIPYPRRIDASPRFDVERRNSCAMPPTTHPLPSPSIHSTIARFAESLIYRQAFLPPFPLLLPSSFKFPMKEEMWRTRRERFFSGYRCRVTVTAW